VVGVQFLETNKVNDDSVESLIDKNPLFLEQQEFLSQGTFNQIIKDKLELNKTFIERCLGSNRIFGTL
jgi:hypothetical protein